MREVSFDALFDAVSRRKALVLWFGVIGALLFGITSIFMPTEYRARILVAPNLNRIEPTAMSLLPAYGGIASLPGIDIGDPSYSAVDLGVEILQSRRFLTGFIARHDLSVPLMAARRWDKKNRQLIIADNLYDESTDTWVRSSIFHGTAIPTDGELFEELSSRMSIIVDSQTGFVELSVDHFSPVIAADWANKLVEDLNHVTMEKEVREASESIAYLEKKTQETPQSNLREVFSKLIEEHLRIVTLANISDEYLFRIIDPAVAPEDHYRPKRILLILLGAGLGLFAGALFSLFRQSGARQE